MMRKPGFTLIELLVVIAMIIVLVGLLLPAVSRARAKARQRYCENNLHQFSIGVILYKDDHGGEFPGWLSNLHPSYIHEKETYLCMSDASQGKDGSKPDGVTALGMGDPYPETDDNNDREDGDNAYRGRNNAVEGCSYMYEFCNAVCGWWSGYVGPGGGATLENVDANGDTIASWCEVKEYQLRHGDKYHSGSYDETTFPMIRCFNHYNEWQYKVNDPGPIDMGLTLNVAYAGNVFRAPIKWELVPIED